MVGIVPVRNDHGIVSKGRVLVNQMQKIKETLVESGSTPVGMFCRISQIAVLYHPVGSIEIEAYRCTVRKSGAVRKSGNSQKMPDTRKNHLEWKSQVHRIAELHLYRFIAL